MKLLSVLLFGFAQACSSNGSLSSLKEISVGLNYDVANDGASFNSEKKQL